jgi:hypothetical protein
MRAGSVYVVRVAPRPLGRPGHSKGKSARYVQGERNPELACVPVPQTP